MQETKEYTASQVKIALARSMRTYRQQMAALMRECAEHESYKGLSGEKALRRVAAKIEGM